VALKIKVLSFLYLLTSEDHGIAKEMVLNIDKTGLLVCPAGKSTFAQEGSVQVPIIAHGDKKQVTATLATSVACDKLPVQVIFAGKTTVACQKKLLPVLGIPNPDKKSYKDKQ
jgi:hypothetical protein